MPGWVCTHCTADNDDRQLYCWYCDANWYVVHVGDSR